MPVLRELITRFKFDTDSKGISNFDKNIRGMKNGIGGLTKLLGVGLGVAGARSMFKLGQSSERAEFVLKRLLGVTDKKGGALRKMLSGIRAEMDAIKAKSGDLVIDKEFDISAADFFKVFGTGQKQKKMFREIFTFASKEAAITEKNVVNIFDSLQKGISGGDFSALLNLPGFDKNRQQLLEFQQKILDSSDPIGRVTLQRRMNVLLRIIRESAGEQAKALKNIPAPLIESDKVAAQLKNTMNDLAKTVNTLLVPALSKLNTVLSKINNFMGSIEEKTKNVESAGFSGMFKDLLNFDLGFGSGGFQAADPFGLLRDKKTGPRATGKIIRTPSSLSDRLSVDQESANIADAISGSVTIHQTNTFSGGNAEENEIMIRRVNKDLVREASNALIPTEDR